MKVIEVTMSNGDVWEVDAEAVADHRISHYRENHTDEPNWEKEEREWLMSDDYELIDWMQNNMDWADIEPHADKIEDGESEDWFIEFINSDMKIVGEDE